MASIGRKVSALSRASVGIGAPEAATPVTRAWRTRQRNIAFVHVYRKTRGGRPLFMDVTKDRLQL